jgi:phosphatidylglycerophosphate synthase
MTEATRLTEGERWALAELERLRAGRWGPHALRDFVWASQIRANRNRRLRPALLHQELAWISVGMGAWLSAGRLPAESSIARSRRQGLIWWAACSLMLDWHLGMVETPDGDAVALGVADALTLVRAWLVPAVAVRADPVLLAIGGVTDAIDGLVARSTRRTRFGAQFDGLVDACFAAAALRGAERVGGVSPAVVWVERVRLTVGAAYVAGEYFAAGRHPDERLRSSGRIAVPVRLAGLVAGGLRSRRLADRLMVGAASLSLVGLLGCVSRRAVWCRAGPRHPHPMS